MDFGVNQDKDCRQHFSSKRLDVKSTCDYTYSTLAKFCKLKCLRIKF